MEGGAYVLDAYVLDAYVWMRTVTSTARGSGLDVEPRWWCGKEV